MATMDLVGIVVHDMESTLAFYRLLGLDIPLDAGSEQHVEVTTPGGIRLAWDTVDLMRSIHGEWAEARGHAVVLAFRCESPSEVDALSDRVTQAGYRGHKPPWDAFWAQRYAVVLDPDGNLVDLFAGLA